MKKQLLFAMLLATGAMSAQMTHLIPWFMGVPSTETIIEVNSGDIVTWTWDDNLPHTVTTDAGGAESFASDMLTGDDQEFSHTFTVEGSTSYACEVHPMMTGTITTVGSTAAIGDVTVADFDFYPNPATDNVTVSGKEIINRVQLFDVTGRQLLDNTATTNSVKIYLNGFSSGTYFLKVYSGAKTKNITVVKK
ncbi:T9SS type A sorting domain-containing protein [Flavobacterium zepuense]|uniref:T9SS type A sorting domain-containing protein n=1 Tax=Flavobacterium zepuense TaxID=2593302 RepID=A0A552UYS1_9FLAO|nr:T9SS type A sorting domain-containing protein [Flavobacterium zepuense]TRW23341.1 T9SS type A sorting domain-containing protein [Flavobacterium zepuense]